MQARTPACANALRVAPNRFDRHQHGPTQPPPQTRRCVRPKSNDAAPSFAAARAAAAPDNPDVYAANPAPRAIALTMTMPDAPGEYQQRDAAGAAMLHIVSCDACVVRATVPRCANAQAAAPGSPAARRGCHVRAIGPAYDAVMSKMSAAAARRSGRTARRARSKEATMPYTLHPDRHHPGQRLRKSTRPGSTASAIPR